MVLGLKGPGRVGRRRFFASGPPERAALSRSVPRSAGRPSEATYTLSVVSTLAIVLIALGAAIALLLIGGILGARRRDRRRAPAYAEHLRQADEALEQARAADRGWDRDVMERVAREALGREHPGVEFDRIELVLVDDRPGVEEDRAHFDAVEGQRRVRVVMARSGEGWAPEHVA